MAEETKPIQEQDREAYMIYSNLKSKLMLLRLIIILPIIIIAIGIRLIY